MDSKFYVSLEAARLLKEKGYNEYCNYYFVEDENRIHHVSYYVNNEEFAECRREAYTAPTKAEAIDWLESKGILIVTSFTYNRKWFCTIKSLVRDEMVSTLDLPTRLEAEEAAIIKACELLKGKEE